MVFYLSKSFFIPCSIMTSIKDWVFSQVISKSVGATRPLSTSESFLSQDSQNELPQDSQDEELGSRGIAFCFIILLSNLLCSSHVRNYTWILNLLLLFRWELLFLAIQCFLGNQMDACFLHHALCFK